MMRGVTGRAALVAFGAMASTSVAAQDSSAPPPSTEATVAIPVLLGIAAAPPGEAPKQWQPLADKGIRFALNYVGEAAANATGGLRRDAAFSGQVYVGADFDLNTMFGLRGGNFHFGVTRRDGKSLSDIAFGNNTSVQEIYGYMGTRLVAFTYEQKLLHDTVDIEVGKSVANIRYLASPLYCNFQSNAVCGNPTIAFKDSNFAGWPASELMINGSARLTDRIGLQAGVFEANPDRTRPDDNNFSFNPRHATGVMIHYELTYGTTDSNDRLPRHYTFGGWFDTGDYKDPLLDNQGAIAILSGQDGATRNGRSAVYVRFDQRLTHPDPHSSRGLTVFGVALANTHGRVVESGFWDLGLLQTGTLKGRDRDTIGFIFSDQRFSSLFLDSMRAARASVGGTQAPHRDEYMMELAYGAQVGDAVRLSPNLQYVVHPDSSGVPFRTTNTANAFVFGLKFTIDAPTLLGEMLR